MNEPKHTKEYYELIVNYDNAVKELLEWFDKEYNYAFSRDPLSKYAAELDFRRTHLREFNI